MLHDLDRRVDRVDPDDVRQLVHGLAFLALLGLGLYVNVLVNG